MLDRLRHHAQRVPRVTEDASEHQAFIELLVAAIYVDHRVTQEELDAIEAFDADHADWEAGAFTIGQYFGPAAGKVRRMREDGLLSMLVIDISARLLDDRVRDEAVAACAALLASDGTTGEEQDFLEMVTAALR